MSAFAINRTDLIDLLARCVAEGWLTEDEAAALLRRDDLPLLPLPLHVALASPIHSNFVTFRSVSGRDALQDDFTQRVTSIAQRTEHDLTDVWHAAMQTLLWAHLLEQARQALGRVLTKDERQELAQLAIGQYAYLSRFADYRWVRAAQGSPLSVAQVTHRATLYSGSGRAVSFQFGERRLGDGYVVDYQARDDARTCDPCIGAEQGSPYLPGTGPLPGAVCLGRGLCRCLRISRYAPVEAARLRSL